MLIFITFWAAARAVRYGIGVGPDRLPLVGREQVGRKAEWPDWDPPAEMIARQPLCRASWPAVRQSARRARDAHLGKPIYRIHGTNAAVDVIGTCVS